MWQNWDRKNTKRNNIWVKGILKVVKWHIGVNIVNMDYHIYISSKCPFYGIFFSATIKSAFRICLQDKWWKDFVISGLCQEISMFVGKMENDTIGFAIFLFKSLKTIFWSVLLWVSQIYPKCILYLCLLFFCILEISGLVPESLFCGCGELSWQSFIANLSLVGRLLILLREEICSPPFLSLSRVIDLLKGSLPTLILYHWRCSFFIGNWFHS